ncbi:hypothetical protein E2562_030001 [Oryza meyeriana var. granulata]|uniref:Uncharacterized protein n=1 Tax=Oryza meyeriana var. granulata TaxID=110450 RepID=A0A6G1FDP1_9ORYZ|nr:hypothetical protein E2562_030001 [Oryza meyeriana var. granulata]
MSFSSNAAHDVASAAVADAVRAALQTTADTPIDPSTAAEGVATSASTAERDALSTLLTHVT